MIDGQRRVATIAPLSDEALGDAMDTSFKIHRGLRAKTKTAKDANCFHHVAP